MTFDRPILCRCVQQSGEDQLQTSPVQQLMQYAANTPGVTGIDLHMHVSSYNGNNGVEGTDPTGGLVAAVQYAQSVFGTTKPMMTSESSLVNYFENYLSDDLSSSFLAVYPDPGHLLPGCDGEAVGPGLY